MSSIYMANQPNNAIPDEDLFTRSQDPKRSRFNDLDPDVQLRVRLAIEEERRWRWAVFARYFEPPPAPLARR